MTSDLVLGGVASLVFAVAVIAVLTTNRKGAYSGWLMKSVRKSKDQEKEKSTQRHRPND